MTQSSCPKACLSVFHDTDSAFCVRHPPNLSVKTEQIPVLLLLPQMLPVPRGCTSASAPSSVTPIRCYNTAATIHSQATPVSLCWFHSHSSSELVLPMQHFSKWIVSAPEGQTEEMRGSDENLPF